MTDALLLGKVGYRILVLDALFFFSGALEVLKAEAHPVSYSPVDSSPDYRKSLIFGLFYKVLYTFELYRFF